MADQLVVAHSHHFALFLEQTIFDALGGESRGVRRQAAFEAAHALLGAAVRGPPRASPREKLELAGELFAAMGQGRLRFEVSAEGGVVHADSLFHGTSFLAKYGGRVQNRLAVDAFASGYCAAAASLAFPSDWGRLDADEVTSVARGDAECTLPADAAVGAAALRRGADAQADRVGAVRWEPDGGPLACAQRVEGAMLEELGALRSDERGLISAYGVNLALVPVGYIDQKTFDTVHLIERRSPRARPGVRGARAGGGADGRVPPARGDALVLVVRGGMRSGGQGSARAPRAAARARPRARLGRSSAPEFQLGRALVLRAPITHESAYYAMKHGSTARGRLLFQQGTALAIMQLLHRSISGRCGRSTPRPGGGLFKMGTRFRAQETKSPLRGDGACEVRVEAVEDRW